MSPALSPRAFDRHHAQALAAALSLLALALVLYHSLAAGTLLSPNVYDSYLLQAQNWLAGRMDIADGASRPWLELAVFEGRYYLSFPPVPSVLALLPAALGLSLGNLWQALWALAALAGVPSPRGIVLEPGFSPAELRRGAEAVGFPLFVKPVRAGSSFGVSRVEEPAQLAPAVEAAFRHDGEILLEEAIPGFEVGCAVLGNRELTVGAVDEVELSRGFFNYTEKYTLQTSAIHCPARIAPQKAAEIRETAKVLYRALGCRGFARVDLFLTPWGEIVFNEVNTIPGFTPHSRYPAMMRAAGIPFRELVSRLIQLGAEL